MSSPSHTHADYVHEAVYYENTADLVAAIAPPLGQALSSGEDVVLACNEPNNRALVEALGNDDRVAVLPRANMYQKAVSAVACLRDLVEGRLAAGAVRVWVVAEAGFGSDGRALDEWRRYETVLNRALHDLPLRSLCAYDVRALPDTVLATGELTHPYVRRDGVQARNPYYVDPAEMMRLIDIDAAPVPEIEPAMTISEVLDFTELHQELTTLLIGERMSHERVQDVVLAVHEVVANGVRHGEPPVTVRVWLSPGRVVCTVSDRGPGFEDPFAGYLRGAEETLPDGRFGLWLARQLCDELVTARTPEGFTSRLVAHY